MLRSHLLAFPVALSVAAGPSIAMAADPRATPACKRGLSIASAGISDIAGRLKRTEKATGEEKCAESRGHFLVLVRARAILADCERGPSRDATLLGLDGKIDDVNGVIAQSCAIQ